MDNKLTDVFACRYSSTSNAVAGTVAVTEELLIVHIKIKNQYVLNNITDDQKSEIEQEHITIHNADVSDLATIELQTE